MYRVSQSVGVYCDSGTYHIFDAYVENMRRSGFSMLGTCATCDEMYEQNGIETIFYDEFSNHSPYLHVNPNQWPLDSNER